MVEETASPGRSPPAPDRTLVGALAQIFRGSPPRVLLVKGPPGSGKTSFHRELLSELGSPHLYLFISLASPPSAPGSANLSERIGLTLLLVDATGHEVAGAEPEPVDDGPGIASLALADPNAPSPETRRSLALVQQAVARLAEQKDGVVVVDSWDRSTEAWLSARATSGLGQELAVSTNLHVLFEQVRHAPTHTILCIPAAESDPRVETIVDGVLELQEERWEGPYLRVATISKSWGGQPLTGRHIFSLDGGRFRCPLPAPIRPPGRIPAPDPDPEPDSADLWPGSTAFAAAFGRLRPHSLTGIDLPPGLPVGIHEMIALPLKAHVLRSGGRVVTIPPPGMPPATILGNLTRMVPADHLRERLRIVSAAGFDPALGDLKSVVLPVRTDIGSGEDLRSATAPPVVPMLREAHQFLRGTPEGRPCLMVITLDGLRSVASVAGFSYNPLTLPLIVSRYTHLPGFRGLGVGAVNDPLAEGLHPSLDLHLRVVEKYGRLILYGIHPPTPAFILGWPEEERGYSLLRVA
jgi:hypothetical protein